jgi:hypothetical protein
MLNYNYQVFVPSLKRNVAFRELSLREVINVNKTIINNDIHETVACFNRVVEECCQEKGLVFNLLDKMTILLSIRSYSISTFCEITINDPDHTQDFKHVLEVNNLINALTTMPVDDHRVLTIGKINIEYGIPYNPTHREIVQVADYIHRVTSEDDVFIDHNSSQEDKDQFVGQIDIKMFNEIVEYARYLVKTFNDCPLYIVKSPFTGKEVVRQQMSLATPLYDLLKMLFTENLHNLYRSIYNFNQTLHISPLYTENITITEKDLLWSYHLKDEQEKERSKQMNTTPPRSQFTP